MIAHGRPGRETKPPTRRWAQAIYHRRLASYLRNAEIQLLLHANPALSGEYPKPPTPKLYMERPGRARSSESAASNGRPETPRLAARPLQNPNRARADKNLVIVRRSQSPKTG